MYKYFLISIHRIVDDPELLVNGYNNSGCSRVIYLVYNLYLYHNIMYGAFKPPSSRGRPRHRRDRWPVSFSRRTVSRTDWLYHRCAIQVPNIIIYTIIHFNKENQKIFPIDDHDSCTVARPNKCYFAIRY